MIREKERKLPLKKNLEPLATKKILSILDHSEPDRSLAQKEREEKQKRNGSKRGKKKLKKNKVKTTLVCLLG